MALTALKQKWSAATQSVRSAFDSAKYETDTKRDNIHKMMAAWNIKSFGEAAIDLARLADEMGTRAQREEGVPEQMRMRVFTALYHLALPQLRYDIAGYWNKPGDELEQGPDGKMKEKDCSRFLAGVPVVTSEGRPSQANYAIKTSWRDDSAPFREALFKIVDPHTPPTPGKKHAIFHQMFDAVAWYDGFCAVSGNPVTTVRLANILSQAAEFRARAYFGAPPLEKDLAAQSGETIPQRWSRAEQYDQFQRVYVIRSNVRMPATVEILSVGQGTAVDKLMRKAMRGWAEDRAAARSVAGEKTREKVQAR